MGLKWTSLILILLTTLPGAFGGDDTPPEFKENPLLANFWGLFFSAEPKAFGVQDFFHYTYQDRQDRHYLSEHELNEHYLLEPYLDVPYLLFGTHRMTLRQFFDAAKNHQKKVLRGDFKPRSGADPLYDYDFDFLKRVANDFEQFVEQKKKFSTRRRKNSELEAENLARSHIRGSPSSEQMTPEQKQFFQRQKHRYLEADATQNSAKVAPFTVKDFDQFIRIEYEIIRSHLNRLHKPLLEKISKILPKGEFSAKRISGPENEPRWLDISAKELAALDLSIEFFTESVLRGKQRVSANEMILGDSIISNLRWEFEFHTSSGSTYQIDFKEFYRVHNKVREIRVSSAENPRKLREESLFLMFAIDNYYHGTRMIQELDNIFRSYSNLNDTIPVEAFVRKSLNAEGKYQSLEYKIQGEVMTVQPTVIEWGAYALDQDHLWQKRDQTALLSGKGKTDLLDALFENWKGTSMGKIHLKSRSGDALRGGTLNTTDSENFFSRLNEPSTESGSLFSRRLQRPTNSPYPSKKEHEPLFQYESSLNKKGPLFFNLVAIEDLRSGEIFPEPIRADGNSKKPVVILWSTKPLPRLNKYAAVPTPDDSKLISFKLSESKSGHPLISGRDYHLRVSDRGDYYVEFLTERFSQSSTPLNLAATFEISPKDHIGDVALSRKFLEDLHSDNVHYPAFFRNLNEHLEQKNGESTLRAIERIVRESGFYTFNPEGTRNFDSNSFQKFLGKDGYFFYQCDGANHFLQNLFEAEFKDDSPAFKEVTPQSGYFTNDGNLSPKQLHRRLSVTTLQDEELFFDGTPHRMDPHSQGNWDTPRIWGGHEPNLNRTENHAVQKKIEKLNATRESLLKSLAPYRKLINPNDRSEPAFLAYRVAGFIVDWSEGKKSLPEVKFDSLKLLGGPLNEHTHATLTEELSQSFALLKNFLENHSKGKNKISPEKIFENYPYLRDIEIASKLADLQDQLLEVSKILPGITQKEWCTFYTSRSH
jgi:hypothetical protein